MSSKTQILLENISQEASDSGYSYGSKKPGAGYHRSRDNVHTATYTVTDFVGTIKLQGTLEIDPAEADWVDINNTTIGGDSSVFSEITLSSSFEGNFVWIRAAYNVQNGSIDSVRFSF
jgi:hypothetical protein